MLNEMLQNSTSKITPPMLASCLFTVLTFDVVQIREIKIVIEHRKIRINYITTMSKLADLLISLLYKNYFDHSDQ